MAYTKNYYHVLSLEAPSRGTHKQVSAAELRRAYKLALLAAHPDKKRKDALAAADGTGRARDTVDDVKEAYRILFDEKTRAEYDTWLLHDSASASAGLRSCTHAPPPSGDFVLGLEVLDLDDFDVLAAPPRTSPTASSASSTPSSSTDSDDAQGAMQWIRPCRCGAEKGFRISEEELQGAEGRGEKEVLVGCEGCSLWVRVGFDVEEG